MKKFLFAGLICALVACAATLPASAQKKQPTKTADPCPNATTQFDMNECAGREYKKADAELNKVYQQLLRSSEPEEQPKLKAAQLAWLKFRDAQCDYESALNVGGTMYPMVVDYCLADVTQARTKQLRDSLNGLERR
jgi:uncharacterized protein YecT (DUF1311 family)